MDALSRLRERMESIGTGAVMVSDPINVGWLTGFTGSFARVIVTPDQTLFVTDSRYTIQAAEEVPGMPIVTFANPVDGDVFTGEHVKSLGISKIGFEGANTSYLQWKRWVEKFDGVQLEPLADIFLDLRMKKSPAEIANIKEACGIADAAFTHISRMVQPGVTEYDLCLDLEFFMRRQGAGVAFPSVVVSGERSARPHGKPSEKKLEVGDFVTFDFGARVRGCNSDMTRTVVVGEATDRHREVYAAVLEAELACIDALRAGVRAKDVDGLARSILGKYDLAKYFGHGLGHGLGLIVHDGGRLSPTSENIIEPNQIWTIEPGVYIEGFGGVRIEDDVLVTEDGIEILTHSPKEMLILPQG